MCLGRSASWEKQSIVRDLLMEAVRYGNDPEVRARLDQVIEGSLDTKKIEELIGEKYGCIRTNRRSMCVRSAEGDAGTRANARRLQPALYRVVLRRSVYAAWRQVLSTGNRAPLRDSHVFEIVRSGRASVDVGSAADESVRADHLRTEAAISGREAGGEHSSRQGLHRVAGCDAHRSGAATISGVAAHWGGAGRLRRGRLETPGDLCTGTRDRGWSQQPERRSHDGFETNAVRRDRFG